MEQSILVTGGGLVLGGLIAATAIRGALALRALRRSPISVLRDL